MIKCILMILILLFTFSCKQSTPNEIIKPSKMQEILWDVFRADALSQQLVKADSAKSLEKESILLTKKVFVIHKITEQQFEKSYTYYTQHPDIMKIIMDSINAKQTRTSILAIPVKYNKLANDTLRKN